MTSKQTVRIGGASGYWGDTASGPRQLATLARLDYMIFDYLAESTMAVLAKARSRDASKGYATDFIDLAMRPLLATLLERKIRIVANAGGVNLAAARTALETLASDLGLRLTIATVDGDNLLDSLEAVRPLLQSADGGQAELPAQLASLNAYMGAFPIARALKSGADIVLTGRCVDSALVLGPLIHEFDWTQADYDLLAQGSLCGHLLECGAQVSGGNFTDWRDTAAGWSDIGFPIAEARPDGSFVMGKPAGTGGRVSRLTVAEQLVYEIADPAAYLLPDVTCDFTAVTLEETGRDLVLVTGARGSAPTASAKVTATYFDGYSSRGASVIVGSESRSKAEHMAAAILSKSEAALALAGLSPFPEAEIDIISGTDDDDAASSLRWGSSVFRIAVRHPCARGAETFAREFTGAGLSMSPGLTPLGQGRPGVSPLIRVQSLLIDKDALVAEVRADGPDALEVRFSGPYADPPKRASSFAEPSVETTGTEVPLIEIAVARSGDKGDNANIGVIARNPEWVDVLRDQLSVARVREHFAKLSPAAVERYELPGIGAFNFVLCGVLGGGGPGSLMLDPLAKTLGQRLLSLPVTIPPDSVAPQRTVSS